MCFMTFRWLEPSRVAIRSLFCWFVFRLTEIHTHTHTQFVFTSQRMPFSIYAPHSLIKCMNKYFWLVRLKINNGNFSAYYLFYSDWRCTKFRLSAAAIWHSLFFESGYSPFLHIYTLSTVSDCNITNSTYMMYGNENILSFWAQW